MKDDTQVNLKRGFFRLWLVGTVLFALAVYVLYADQIISEFERKSEDWAYDNISDVLVPVMCASARGEIGVDYTTKSTQKPGPWDKYANPNAFDDCWFSLQKFRKFYPEYKDLTDAKLVYKLYAEADISISKPPEPWKLLGSTSILAFGPPMALLGIGSALYWAILGFRKSKN